MRRPIVLVLAVLGFAGMARAELEVIPLRHRPVEQLMPTLQGLVERGGAVQGMNGQIIVRASPANIDEIRRALASLDTPVRRLLISVTQDAATALRTSGVAVSGNVSSDTGSATVGRPGGPDRIELVAQDAARSRDERISQQVQGLEGSPAAISLGRSVPVTTTTVGPFGTQTTTSVHALDTGFAVIPRLAGDRVFLDIAPQRATPGGYGPGSANVQRIATTVSGSLGEWIELGGAVEEAVTQVSGIGAGGAAAAFRSGRVWVRVEELK